MLPTIHSNDFLFVEKLSSRWKGFRAGDIITAQSPTDPGEYICKRITCLVCCCLLILWCRLECRFLFLTCVRVSCGFRVIMQLIRWTPVATALFPSHCWEVELSWGYVFLCIHYVNFLCRHQVVWSNFGSFLKHSRQTSFFLLKALLIVFLKLSKFSWWLGVRVIGINIIFSSPNAASADRFTGFESFPPAPTAPTVVAPMPEGYMSLDSVINKKNHAVSTNRLHRYGWSRR